MYNYARMMIMIIVVFIVIVPIAMELLLRERKHNKRWKENLPPTIAMVLLVIGVVLMVALPVCIEK